MADLIRQCCVCKRYKSIYGWEEPDQFLQQVLEGKREGNVTHGYCETCMKKVKEELELETLMDKAWGNTGIGSIPFTIPLMPPELRSLD